MAQKMKDALLDTELRIVMSSRVKAKLRRAGELATRRGVQKVTMGSIARDGIDAMLEKLAKEEKLYRRRTRPVC